MTRVSSSMPMVKKTIKETMLKRLLCIQVDTRPNRSGPRIFANFSNTAKKP